MVFDLRTDVRHPLLFAILAGIVLLTSLPLLTGKYLFLLDQVHGPNGDTLATRFFGFGPPGYGGSLSLFVILDGIEILAGADTAQKFLWIGLLSLVAVSGYVLLPGSRWVCLYGTLLLLVNPFVYTRLLVGHWAVIWGLAMFPLLLYTYTNYLEDPRPRTLVPTVGAVTLLGFSAHVLYASTVLLALITLFRYVDHHDPGVIRKALTVTLVAVPVNAYWLVPALLGDGSSLSTVSTADLSTFAPRGGQYSALYSTASMHGFWRSGYVYTRDIFPPVELLYLVVLLLAEYGFVTHYDDEDRGYVVKALAVTAVVALLLGAGVSGPAEPAFRWMFEHVPFFAGMRDSNKFVALLVLAYAYLGALGVEQLLAKVRRLDRSRWLRVAVIVLVVLTPLTYTFPMVTGYASQVSAQDYPEEWYEVDRMLESDPGEYNVLFLPWHQYMDYSWIEGRQQRIAMPARDFFSKPIIQGDNVEAGGVYSTSGNPVSEYVQSLFGLGPGNEPPDVSNMGELLAHVNVKYVLVTKEADWRYYDSILRDQRDLTLVRENEHFRVYRNERRVDRAFATDQVTYVEDRSEFVASSDGGDTSGVYVLDESRAEGTERVGSPDVEPLDITERSPVDYRVEGTDREYTVVTQPQVAAGDGWMYDGDRPVHRHLGVQPVFASDSEGTTVRYAPFYRLYLPSYVVSVAAGILLAWYGLVGRGPVTVLRRTWRDGFSWRADDD